MNVKTLTLTSNSLKQSGKPLMLKKNPWRILCLLDYKRFEKKLIRKNVPGILLILKDKNFKKHFGTLESEHTLTRVPKGIDPDHPAAEFLKYTSFIASEPLTLTQLKSKDLIKSCVASYKALVPLLDFLNRVND